MGVDAGPQAHLEKEFAEMAAQVGKVGGQVGAVQEGLDHDRLLRESQVLFDRFDADGNSYISET